MPGMNTGLSPADPTLVAAFRSALLHQGVIALQALPLAPAGTATLAPGPGSGGFDTLAVSGARLAVWRLAGTARAKVQVINVPIEYGSSG